jgi:hypothetical protein
MPRRAVERIEFRPGDGTSVLDAMATISEASDGWINLLPGIDPDDEPPPPTGLSAILSPRTAGVVMATWAPPATNRNGYLGGASVGIMHSAGRFAARQLAGLGAPLPEGWIVRQDNPRRGLIVTADVAASNSDVLDWMIAATTALCSLTLTGDWAAQVYLPRIRPNP